MGMVKSYLRLNSAGRVLNVVEWDGVTPYSIGTDTLMRIDDPVLKDRPSVGDTVDKSTGAVIKAPLVQFDPSPLLAAEPLAVALCKKLGYDPLDILGGSK